MIDSHGPLSTIVSCDRCGKTQTHHYEMLLPALAVDTPFVNAAIEAPPISEALNAFVDLDWIFNAMTASSICPDCRATPSKPVTWFGQMHGGGK